MPSQITNIVIHHSATAQKPIDDVLDGINNSHKTRNFPIGSMGLYVGYHYLVDLNGRVLQTRDDSDVGAHCREQQMNYKSIGICLIGNFMSDKLTNKQEKSLVNLLKALKKKYKINTEAIKLHRDYKQTACAGDHVANRLSDLLAQCDELDSTYAEWQVSAKKFAVKNELIKNWDNLPFSVEQTMWLAQVLKNYTEFLEEKNK